MGGLQRTAVALRRRQNSGMGDRRWWLGLLRCKGGRSGSRGMMDTNGTSASGFQGQNAKGRRAGKGANDEDGTRTVVRRQKDDWERQRTTVAGFCRHNNEVNGAGERY